MNIMPNNIVQPPAQLHVLSIDVLPRSGTKVPTQVLAVQRTKPLSPEFGEFRLPNGNGANLRRSGQHRKGPTSVGPKKGRAEGATALPKASLSRLCRCLFFFKPAPKHPEPQIQRLTQPPPPNRAKLEEQNAKQHRSPDLNSLIRRLCTLFDGEGGLNPRRKENRRSNWPTTIYATG
jgi:hypothetical protein